MITENERWRQLVQENQRLQNQLRRAGVTQLLPRADLPNKDELATLHEMVMRQYREQLSCPIDQFRRAMYWAAWARRQDKLNAGFYPSHWGDCCQDFLLQQGLDTGVSLRAVIAACCASQILVSDLSRWPFDVCVGLTRGYADRPSSAWRAVLAAGRLPEPTRLANRPPLYRQNNYVDMTGAARSDGVEIKS